MFSMLGASAFLPFLPMLPAQVLLNNFLYDSSQLSLSSDKVDEEDVKKPPVLNMHFLQKYMLVFGAVSSVFDFITFGVLYLVLRLPEGQFQSGWFFESMATQIFVVYIIRTKRIPFLESSPSKFLFFNTALIVLIALAIPMSPLASIFGFKAMGITTILSIFAIVSVYLVCTEFVKRAFYKYLIKKNQIVV
jgi:Mg2+-importing ATPase